MSWLFSAIHHFHIDHNDIKLVYPLEFCVTIVFDFSWDDCDTQEKLETVVFVKLWSKQAALWSMWVKRPFSQLPKASVSKRGYIKALIFTRNVLYLASFWKWEFLEIGIEVLVLCSFVLWDCYGYAITSFISQLCVRPFLEVRRQEIWYSETCIKRTP